MIAAIARRIRLALPSSAEFIPSLLRGSGSYWIMKNTATLIRCFIFAYQNRQSARGTDCIVHSALLNSHFSCDS
jgi:hypothetical protein